MVSRRPLSSRGLPIWSTLSFLRSNKYMSRNQKYLQSRYTEFSSLKCCGVERIRFWTIRKRVMSTVASRTQTSIVFGYSLSIARLALSISRERWSRGRCAELLREDIEIRRVEQRGGEREGRMEWLEWRITNFFFYHVTVRHGLLLLFSIRFLQRGNDNAATAYSAHIARTTSPWVCLVFVLSETRNSPGKLDFSRAQGLLALFTISRGSNQMNYNYFRIGI